MIDWFSDDRFPSIIQGDCINEDQAPAVQSIVPTCLTLYSHSSKWTKTNKVLRIGIFRYALPSVTILGLTTSMNFTIPSLKPSSTIHTSVIMHIVVMWDTRSIVLTWHILTSWQVTFINVEPVFCIWKDIRSFNLLPVTVNNFPTRKYNTCIIYKYVMAIK